MVTKMEGGCAENPALLGGGEGRWAEARHADRRVEVGKEVKRVGLSPLTPRRLQGIRHILSFEFW
jgi:hypothetical protein